MLTHVLTPCNKSFPYNSFLHVPSHVLQYRYGLEESHGSLESCEFCARMRSCSFSCPFFILKCNLSISFNTFLPYYANNFSTICLHCMFSLKTSIFIQLAWRWKSLCCTEPNQQSKLAIRNRITREARLSPRSAAAPTVRMLDTWITPVRQSIWFRPTVRIKTVQLLTLTGRKGSGQRSQVFNKSGNCAMSVKCLKVFCFLARSAVHPFSNCLPISYW